MSSDDNRASSVSSQQFELGLQMHRDTHDLIRSLKSDITVVMDKLDGHIAEDRKVHDVVNRHTTYWKAFSGGVTAVLTGIGAHLGWK